MTRVKQNESTLDESKSKRNSKADSKVLGKRSTEVRSPKSTAPITIV